MDKKILQIIPAPQNMVAIYEDCEDPGKAFTVPVVCLALTECDGEQVVEAMTITESWVSIAHYDGFIGLELEAHQ